MPPILKLAAHHAGIVGIGIAIVLLATVWLKRQPRARMQRLYSADVAVPFCGAPSCASQNELSTFSASSPRFCFSTLVQMSVSA